MNSSFWFDLASVFRTGRSAVPADNPLYAALKAMADKCTDIAAREAEREGRL